MRPSAKGYLLREYGSWSVLIVAFLTGLLVGGNFTWRAFPLFLALGLLINSKQAFVKWSRMPADRTSLLIFLAQVLLGGGTLLLMYRGNLPQLLPLLIFPAAYLVSNKAGGEHFVLTELLGFVLLSLAAVLAKFLVIGVVDVRLFVAAALYFTAGVFKVKAVLLKKPHYRALAVLHVLFAAYVYSRCHIALIILLPLAENVVMAFSLYKVRLKTTGWIEVAKSLLFLILCAQYF